MPSDTQAGDADFGSLRADLDELDDRHLMAWVAQRGVSARLVEPGVPTPTVPTAATALGVGVQSILKSLVFSVRGRPRLVIAAGVDRVRYPALAEVWGVSRREVRMCAPEEASTITGYRVGAMPPFGHREALPTLVDERCVRPERTVYAGGGSRSALLELTSAELLRALAENAHEADADRPRSLGQDPEIAELPSPVITDVTTPAVKE